MGRLTLTLILILTPTLTLTLTLTLTQTLALWRVSAQYTFGIAGRYHRTNRRAYGTIFRPSFVCLSSVTYVLWLMPVHTMKLI